MIELQRCNDKSQWDDYIVENGGHPLQLWSWGQVKADSGWKVERFFGSVDGEIVACAQVLIRPLPYPFTAFAYIPRGPLVATTTNTTPATSTTATAAAGPTNTEVEADFLNTLAQFAKREYKAVALSVEPDTEGFTAPEGWLKSTNTILSAETILLDLRKSESDLLAVMAKKTRQYIRKSATEVTIKQAKTHDDVKACLALYKETSVRAGFNLHANQYYLNVFNHLQEYSPIFIAYQHGEPVAFLWLAISGETAYELYGGVNAVGQEVRANYALKWHAIKKTKEWGLRRYDFGGLVAGGVTTFKQGWSAAPVTFAGTYDRPLSPLYTVWSRGLPTVKRYVQRLKQKK